MKVILRPWQRRLLIAAAAALGLFLVFFAVLRLIPYPELEAYRNRSYAYAVHDRNGRVLRVFPAKDGVKREWVDLEDIPPAVAEIFIKAEDRRFYFHPGIDSLALVRSALRNLQAGRTVSGASTISMQLARLVKPHPRGMKGKIGEAFDALRLEARLSKKEILELWLNGIPFGSNIEGIAAISRARFGIPVGRLDDSRALLLALIPRRPALYDPALNPEKALGAALSLTEKNGLALGEAELRRALSEAALDTEDKAPFRAPHFTERLIREASASSVPRVFRSTLDLELQDYAEERLNTELARLTDHRVSNGAVFAIENSTGAVRVYVGSRSWFDDGVGGKIDGIMVRNQPGSCLKPFLYALALDRGFSPGDIVPDIPTVFGGSEAYMPGNFDRRFNGPVRFRISLASSLNVPAVHLLERLGVGAFEEYLIALGFDSIASTRGSHGTGLALGNAEVSLEELVRAFSAFPRGGSPAELRWIEPETGHSGDGDRAQASVGEDALGDRAQNSAPSPMSPEAAWIISDILSDRSSRFVGFGPAENLNNSFPSMYKTGTANQFQHIWALGASGRFTVGVWMGNFSGETVVGRTGSSIPARIVSELLAALEISGDAEALSGDPAHVGGPVPRNIRETSICALSGMAATPLCGGTVKEWMREDQSTEDCSWHRGTPSDPRIVYPAEYQTWISGRFRSGSVVPPQAGSGRIRIPAQGSVFYLDPSLPADAQAARIETNGFSAGAHVFLNDMLQGALNHGGSYMLPLMKGRQRVTVEDEQGSSASVEFEVR